MAASDQCFVEWKEQFVSKERGNRVVHYFLKDSSGESILAVVGTERSVRHMFYVVSEEFLNAYGAENSVHAGFRWRSRREVVNWLTSMLSKQHRQSDCSRSPKDDPIFAVNIRQPQIREPKGRLARNLRGNPSDIVWSDEAWACGKQLKHFPAFCRNGVTIAVQSFVYVMAEKENRYLAYLEDMYEDRKGHKKVKVRWFHHNREVRGVVSVRNPHPKEVFITPYAQVISAECVDGPAIVLTREHYEKCIAVFPNDVFARAHFCFRQFKSNRVKPFKLSKLGGYFNQPIFSCFSRDFFEDEEFSSGDEVKVGVKRTKRGREPQHVTNKFSSHKLKYGLLNGGPNLQKHVEGQFWQTSMFNVNDKIEFLCQDSGIRGCWFRCTVLEISRRQMRIQYDDIEDEDGCGYLEEWIPAFRLATPDKFGMRYPGRPTIRPAVTSNQMDDVFKVGAPVDAWWSDGWWEGVVTGNYNSGKGSYQVYIPSENLVLNIDKKKLRISRDWVGDQWMDVEGNPDILSIISAAISLDSKHSVSSAITKEVKSDGSPVSCLKAPTDIKLDVVHETPNGACADSDQQQVFDCEDREHCGKQVDDSDVRDNAESHLADNSSVMANSQNSDDDNEGSHEDKLAEIGTGGRQCEAERAEAAE
ncbi:uncharacterized protein LOC113770746 [Coffea eugenioides]|uniref:uncharacterized protein LOC113770746 n=1 Tax=Coffea eugenioides TaxID=49369 RepID=UPI000F6110BD|nr:uncharacterized protein LOC113770746 [Coffea eugenioides]